MSGNDNDMANAHSDETLTMLESLRRATRKALERKRRLGEYYVVWQEGRPVAIGEDAPRNQNNDSTGQR